MSSAPLTGFTVVENDSFVAGPSACLALAQLGADVIKIDPIGGGPDIDRWPITPAGDSIYWATLNRSKRSVAIDLRAPEGQELAQAIITAAGEDTGIFVDNNVGRPFLADEVLRARRADLIHVKVQGSADGGPGVDYTVNAAAGIPLITGPEDHLGPVNHALPAWDFLCGQAAVTAVTLGLLNRARTGAGIYEEIALSDIAVSAVANLGWYTETLQPAGGRTPQGNHIYGSFGTSFPTADGRYVMVTAITRRQWRSLLAVTGTEAAITAVQDALGADFTAEADRYAHRSTLAAILAPWFAARTAAELDTQLADSGVLWSHYATPAEVAAAALRGTDAAGAPTGTTAADATDASGTAADAADASGTAASPAPQLPAPAALSPMDGGALGTLLVGTQPIRIDGARLASERPTVFGAATEAVLAERLGLAAAEIGRLVDAGIVATRR